MNPNNVNNFFGVKVSKPGINVANASDKELVYKDNYTTKTYYDDTNSRIVEGLLPDGNYGMWVSSTGQDVTTADPTTPNQLIFNSNQQTFKVVQSGTGTIPDISVSNSSTVRNSTNITHNLGYVPLFFVFVDVFTAVLNPNFNFIQTYTQLPIQEASALIEMYQNSGTAIYAQWSVAAAADTANLYVTQIFTTTSSGAGNVGAIPFIYYLIQPTFS